MRKINSLLFAATFSGMLFSCGGGNDQSTSSSLTDEKPAETVTQPPAETASDQPQVEEQKAEEETAICLWGSVGLRETSDPKSKYLTSIKFGELVTFLGEKKEDGKRTYIKIKSSDGQIGWANEYLFAVDAQRGVVTKEMRIYSKPDFMTKTDKKLAMGEVVAILNNPDIDGFKEVVGKEKATKGWVKSSSTGLSTEQIDLELVGEWKRINDTKDNAAQRVLAQEILDNADYSTSSFYVDLQERFGAEAQVQKIIDEETEEETAEIKEIIEEEISEEQGEEATQSPAPELAPDEL